MANETEKLEEMNFEGVEWTKADLDTCRRRTAPAIQNIPVRTELGMEIRRAFVVSCEETREAYEARLLANEALEEKP